MTSTSLDSITVAPDRLATAAATAAPCAPVRDLIDASDIDTAYAVQQHNVENEIRSGRVILPRKTSVPRAI